jgi:hypothetical protein
VSAETNQRAETDTLAVPADPAFEPDFCDFALLLAGFAGTGFVTLILFVMPAPDDFLLACPSVTTNFCPACT